MKYQNRKFEHFSPEKRELVAKLLREKNIEKRKSVVLQPVQGTVFPVSYSQEVLLNQTFSAPNDYPSLPNLVISYELEGNIDTSIVEQSYNELIDRHKGLRSSFFKTADSFQQRLKQKAHYPIIYEDLRNRKIDDSSVPADYITRETTYKFDLQNELLYRLSLLQVSSDKYYLVNNIHHLITDTWSNILLAYEFMKIYKSILRNGTNTLEPPQLHHTDYSYWERAWLQTEEAENQIAFWKDYLSNAAPLELETDFPREKECRQSLFLNEELTVKSEISNLFSKFCENGEVPIFTGVLSIFYTLLRFYSKSDDICLGTYTSLRNKSETFSLVGYLVNDITIRANVDRNQSFDAFLKQIRKNQLECLSRQQIPGVLIQKLLNNDGGNANFRLHRVLCLFSQNEDAFNISFKDQKKKEPAEPFAEPDDLPWIATLVQTPEKDEYGDQDLILDLFSEAGKMRLKLWYNVSLFKSETVRTMLSRMEKLLVLFAEKSRSPIAGILEEINRPPATDFGSKFNFI